MRRIKCWDGKVAMAAAWLCSAVFAGALSLAPIQALGAGSSINEQAAALQPGEWLAAPLTGQASDIVNFGTLAEYKDTWGTGKMTYANCVCTGDASVNGVPLGVGYGDAHEDRGFQDMPKEKKDGYGNCGLDSSSEYASILDTGREFWQSYGVRTFKLSGLASGTNYLVQVIIHHKNRAKSTATAGGQTIHYGAADSSGEWYYGGTLIHVFTALADTYEFQIDFGADEGGTAISQINAVQVRAIPEPKPVLPPIAERADALTSEDGWLAAEMNGDATDFATNGVCIAATAASQSLSGIGDASVAGIPFSSAKTYFEGSGYIDWSDTGWDASTETRGWFCFAGTDPTTDYAKIMGGARLCNNDVTVTLNQLEVGREYLIQIFIHNGRYNGIQNGEDGTGGSGNQDEYLRTASIDGQTVRYGGKTSDDDWYYGGTLLKVFRAEASTYSFTVNYAGGPGGDYAAPQYNAVQVRLLPDVVRPITPSFVLGTPVIADTTATIPLEKVVMGTDLTGETAATKYNVFAYTGDDPTTASEVAPNQSGKTANFQITDLAAGTSVYNVYIVNDLGVSSATNAVTVKNVKTANVLAKTLKVGDWLAVPMTGDPDDIVTYGTSPMVGTAPNQYPMAYGKGTFTGDATVNGLLFTDSKANLTLDPNIWTNESNDKGCGTTGDYYTIMTKYWGSQTASGSDGTAFTYSNLDPTATYLVQIILHNGRDDNFSKGYQYAATAGGKTVHLSSETSDGEWYYGGSLLHVFKPDQDGSYTFHVLYTKTTDGSIITAQLNAIQLREITLTQTIAEQAAELTAGDWLVAPMTGNPSDIVTRGELAKKGDTPRTYAPRAISGDSSVSSVSFLENSILYYDCGMAFDMNRNSVATENSLGNCGHDGDAYGKLMANAYIGSDVGERHILLNGLTVGQTYLFQGIIHDGTHPTRQVSVGGGTITYGADSPSDEWYYGGTFIHVFTADSESYDITLDYTDGLSHMNAMQLRVIQSGDDPEEPEEPVVPSIGNVVASASKQTATITLSDVVIGTDAEAVAATDYTAYLTYTLVGGESASAVLAHETAATCTFTLPNLEAGDYTYSVVITNSADIGSAPKTGNFRVKSVVPGSSISEQAENLLESQGWIAAPMTGDASDFVTEGYVITNYWNNYTISSVFAYSCNDDIPANDPSVAGVPWRRPGSRALEIAPYWAGNTTAYYYGLYGSKGNTGNVTTGYDRLLTGGWDGNQNHYTFTIKDLEPHATYVVQLIIHSNRGKSRSEDSGLYNPYDQLDQYKHTAVIGGETIQYGDEQEGGEWWYGGTFVKVFSADRHGEFSFNVDYPEGSALYNAIQVRKIDRSTPSETPVAKVAPQLGSASVEVSGSNAIVSFTGLNRGSDDEGLMAKNVDVYLAYGPQGEALPLPKLVATSSESIATALLTGLEPGTYDFSAFAMNKCGESAPVYGSFTIAAGADPATEKPILVINEIMASNPGKAIDGGLPTANNYYGLDWVEIYNGSDVDIDITGWYLYDDPKDTVADWKRIHGDAIVPANGYKIVWCDKDYANYTINEAYSHINLSTAGETLFLASPDGKILSSVAMPSQIKGISYGLGKLQGSDEIQYVYFSTPTPNAKNGEYGAGPMTPKVVFDIPHGYKTEAIDVTITCPDDSEADIYYTTDGSSPTTSSTKYTGPVHISKTTVLRAGVPRGDSILQQDTSATYIYLDDVLAAKPGVAPVGFPSEKNQSGQFVRKDQLFRYGMSEQLLADPEARARIQRGFTNTVATISLVIDPEHMFSESKGIYVNAKMKYDWQYSPDDEWERPMLIEQIDPVKGAKNEFSAPAGIRIRGAGSRGGDHAKHSFKVIFRSMYGMGKLAFPLFGKEGADEFERFDLRCSQNHSWANEDSMSDTFIHEVFSRDSQRDMGEYYTRSRYYNLFINGVYWGLYQTQERGDEDFAATYNGGNADNYDMVKTVYQNGYRSEASGDKTGWEQLTKFDQEGFAGDYFDNYMKLIGRNPDGTRNPAYPCYLNPTNLMVYMISSHYACDSDCPAAPRLPNNLYLLRDRVDGDAKKDGFFFLRHDAEHSLGVREANADDQATMWSQLSNDPTGYGTHDGAWLEDGRRPDNGTWKDVGFNPAELHWELCKNSIYRRAFGDQFYKHCLRPGGAMTEEKALARFTSRMAEIDDVIVCEAARWSKDQSNPKTREDWLRGCGYCLDFITNRMPYMVSQYRNRGWYPSVDTPEPDIWDGPIAEGATVTFSMNPTNTYDQVYVTTDGSDPADSATAVTGLTLAIPSGVSKLTVKARAKKGDEWSALQEVTYAVGTVPSEDDGYTFRFSGDYEGVQTVTPTGSECVVILDGANIPDGLILNAENADFIIRPIGDDNRIGSVTGETAKFKLDGEGTVSLEGEGTLMTISNLVVKSGTLALKTTGIAEKDVGNKTKVVNVLGHVKQTGGVIDLDIGLDSAEEICGLYVKNKNNAADDIYAEFSGGQFLATVGGTKSSAIFVNKGSVDALFSGTFEAEVALKGEGARFLDAAGDIKISAGTFNAYGADTATKARFIKCGEKLTIRGGSFDVECVGAESEIFAATKTETKESTITVAGGTFELKTTDDCFNADDHIVIDGGLFYAVSTENDVFDSNGDITVNGGIILAYAEAAGHEAFDVDPIETVDYGIPHILKINGGTIFATGGADAKWPKNVAVADGARIFMETGLDADGYSEKYLALAGSGNVTYTAKLPAMSGTCAVLAICPGFDGNPTTSDVEPSAGDQEFHYLYIVEAEATNQSELRIYEIYGSTTTGGGDTGEYIVLTNRSDKTVQLKGVVFKSNKVGKSASVSIVLEEGTVDPYGSVRLDQATYADSGWTKITNGSIEFQLIDAKGTLIQRGAVKFDNDKYPDTDGKGASLIALRFDDVMLDSTEYWRSSKEEPVPPVADPDAPIIGGEEITDPIVVTSDKVTIKISNAGIGFTYGYKKSVTLEGLKSAAVTWLAAPADEAGILAIAITKDPAEPTCFYQILVK